MFAQQLVVSPTRPLWKPVQPVSLQRRHLGVDPQDPSGLLPLGHPQADRPLERALEATVWAGPPPRGWASSSTPMRAGCRSVHSTGRRHRRARLLGPITVPRTARRRDGSGRSRPGAHPRIRVRGGRQLEYVAVPHDRLGPSRRLDAHRSAPARRQPRSGNQFGNANGNPAVPIRRVLERAGPCAEPASGWPLRRGGSRAITTRVPKPPSSTAHPSRPSTTRPGTRTRPRRRGAG